MSLEPDIFRRLEDSWSLLIIIHESRFAEPVNYHLAEFNRRQLIPDERVNHDYVQAVGEIHTDIHKTDVFDRLAPEKLPGMEEDQIFWL